MGLFMEENLMLEMPVLIDNATKDLIKRAYYSAVDDMEQEEFNYINSKINIKVSITENISPEWVATLSKYYKRLHFLLEEYRNNDIKITGKSYNSIGAALFYFINPYDIIPDFTSEIGYADDFYVLILCLDSIDQKDKEIVLSRLKIND